MQDGKIQWHPAFSSALKIDLEEDAEKLEFKEEYLLGSKPMQIDILVVKKSKDVHIRKSIGHIFKMHNIIEYKSPEDYLSEDDYYKVCGYACFYKSDSEKVGAIPKSEITISMVCSHFPFKMVKHVVKEYGMEVEKYDEGIYYLNGGMFPIQLIVNYRLSQEDYFWIQSLRSNLRAGGQIRNIMSRYELNKSSDLYQSVMSVIIEANKDQMEVERNMRDVLWDFFEDTLMEMVDEKGEEIAKDRAEHLAQDMAKDMAKDIAEDMAKDIAKDMAQDIAQSMAQDMARNMAQEIAQKELQTAKKIFKMNAAGKSVSEIAKECQVSEDKVREILE